MKRKQFLSIITTASAGLAALKLDAAQSPKETPTSAEAWRDYWRQKVGALQRERAELVKLITEIRPAIEWNDDDALPSEEFVEAWDRLEDHLAVPSTVPRMNKETLAISEVDVRTLTGNRT